MHFLDFEKPLEALYLQAEEIKNNPALEDADKEKALADLDSCLEQARAEIYTELSPWQKVQIARHPERPYTLHYIKQFCEQFTELHGDRTFRDDKSIVGGLGIIDGQTVMIIGQQKGENTKARQYRNFGMPYPDGYRKALRLMRMAERFQIPVLCLIDTPGAFPGIEAEERGQAQAIAQNLFAMAQLETPIVCVVIGEGASGGALGIGVGNTVFMLEHTWYTVISPESCATILWKSSEHKIKAANALKLTAADALELGIIDKIIPEPIGGAHSNPRKAAQLLKPYILEAIHALQKMSAAELVEHRIAKFSKMGIFDYI
jgi:acetyl-CoA carboxylase carboxyl transferase subunit alpha